MPLNLDMSGNTLSDASAPEIETCAFRRSGGQYCRRKVQANQQYCWQHARGFANRLRSFSRNQQLGFALTLLFGLAGVFALAVQLIDRQHSRELLAREPVVALAIGQLFESTTLITLANKGSEPVVNLEVNLRCFFLLSQDDVHPGLLFDGFPSLDNSHGWWKIDSLEPGQTRTTETIDAAVRYLHNKAVMENSHGRPPSMPPVQKMVLAVDVSYQRRSDLKRFTISGIAELFRDSQTGKPFLEPLPMTDFYRELLKTVRAPNYRVES
jgi:hypothetical protein